MITDWKSDLVKSSKTEKRHESSDYNENQRNNHQVSSTFSIAKTETKNLKSPSLIVNNITVKWNLVSVVFNEKVFS